LSCNDHTHRMTESGGGLLIIRFVAWLVGVFDTQED
jgi:hypothetical protein